MHHAADHFRDLDQLVTDVLRRYPIREGQAFVALVRDPAGQQEVCRVRRIPINAHLADGAPGSTGQASSTLRTVVERLEVPPRDESGIQHRLVTFIGRRGLAVFGAVDSDWLDAWKYSHHHAAAFDGDVVTVTEHGWYEWWSDTGAWRPRLAP